MEEERLRNQAEDEKQDRGAVEQRDQDQATALNQTQLIFSHKMADPESPQSLTVCWLIM